MLTTGLSAMRGFLRRLFAPAVGPEAGFSPPPPEPVGKVYLYGVHGVNPDDPDDWASGVCLRQYGTHELHQAIRDAHRKFPARLRGYERQVRDGKGRVFCRVRATDRRVAA